MAFLQSCRPLSHMWQVYPDPGRYCQPATSPVLVWVYFGFDTVTNLYLASAATPVAARKDKPTWEKLQWFATLACGLLATAAAVARAVILVSVCIPMTILDAVGNLRLISMFRIITQAQSKQRRLGRSGRSSSLLLPLASQRCFTTLEDRSLIRI